ncbi:MAG: DJ-1/PfpI family protein [Lachnospiraceae bacterium]|nr:DJ-1/PfpI family protein [Lachnospiraceae bacterium]
MSRAAVFLADGFEEVEALAPVDMMRRAGITVTTFAVGGSIDVYGSHGIKVEADTSLAAAGGFGEFDLLMLPGGGDGTKNLEQCARLLEELKTADEAGKMIAAICAAPRILGRLGMLEGRRAVCYPGNEEHLKGAELHPECRVVADGRYITARGMGASIEFGAAIIEALEGKDKADDILKRIQF